MLYFYLKGKYSSDLQIINKTLGQNINKQNSKKIFLNLFKIHGFSFKFFYFIYPALGLNFFFFSKFIFYKKYIKYSFLFLINKKLLIFVFLLRNNFNLGVYFYRSFFFKYLKQQNCLKLWCWRLDLPIKGQRTKTNNKSGKLKNHLHYLDYIGDRTFFKNFMLKFYV